MKQNESTNLFCLYFLALSTIDIQYDLTYYIHINIRASKCKTMELYIYKKKNRPTDPIFLGHVTGNKHFFFLGLSL